MQAAIMVPPSYKPEEFICGGAAAFTNISITFPINKVIFRQQLHGINALKAVNELYKEGLTVLYRGFLPPLAQKTASMAIMFGMFDHYKRYLSQTTTWSSRTQEVYAAMMAGTLEACLCPFERIQTLMQDKQYHGHFRNTVHAAKELMGYGVREYYRGVSCILLRNGPSNVAFFLFRKPIKELFPATHTEVGNIIEDFVSGAVLGATLSTFFYPVNVIKTRMQSTMGGRYVGIIDTFKTVFHERNYSWRIMFRGANVNFTRSLLSWGIINASYEFYRKTLLQFDYFKKC